MDALEHVIGEAPCAELAQALVMLYCRHLSQPDARRTLRLMAYGHQDLTRQFDDLDELHARHPFRDLGKDALATELRSLYRHHLLQHTPKVLRQLRLLCRYDEGMIAAFDALDRDYPQAREN